jgi:hypothetical protein
VITIIRPFCGEMGRNGKRSKRGGKKKINSKKNISKDSG